jgi:thiamine-phosphate pyrophosphorylase
MLRYAITSRMLYRGDGREKRAALLHEAARWASEGVDVIQLREKDLCAAEMAGLAREILKAIARTTSHTKLLINSRPDIAIATGAHGVHLTAASGELTPGEVRQIYATASLPVPIITVSCHSLEEARPASEDRADGILFGPVFEKIIPEHDVIAGQGLDQLRAACMAAKPVPVYALGGVTFGNAASCVAAGASGIAGIRLFLKP